MRIVKVFWALDASLAYARHFPAVNWLNSYSLYLDSLRPWFEEHLGKAFVQNRTQAMLLLQQEASLNEIVQLVGKDGLAPGDQLTLETAKMIREDFLQQNAFVEVDSFSNYDRQSRLLAMILDYDRALPGALEKGQTLMRFSLFRPVRPLAEPKVYRRSDISRPMKPLPGIWPSRLPS